MSATQRILQEHFISFPSRSLAHLATVGYDLRKSSKGRTRAWLPNWNTGRFLPPPYIPVHPRMQRKACGSESTRARNSGLPAINASSNDDADDDENQIHHQLNIQGGSWSARRNALQHMQGMTPSASGRGGRKADADDNRCAPSSPPPPTTTNFLLLLYSSPN